MSSTQLLNLKNSKHQILSEISALYSVTVDTENNANWNSDWDIWWMDSPNSLDRLTMKKLKPCQQTNHFIATTEIGIKSHLARNLNRMAHLFPEEYNFHPKSFVLPKELKKLKDYFASLDESRSTRTIIVKPFNYCEGREFKLWSFFKRQLDELVTGDGIIILIFRNCVIQEYIDNPLLIEGYKFDIRLYVVISSIDPLKIFLHKDGLVRLATEKYEPPSEVNHDNVCMHLTNYTVNKISENFAASTEEHNQGSKRTFSWLLDYLRQHYGHEATEKLLDDITAIVAKTIIAVQPTISALTKACFPPQCTNPAFELLGFDILVDSNLKPWLEEVNQSPSLTVDTPVDVSVKRQMLMDTFRLLNIGKLPSSVPENTGPKVVPGFWRVFPTQKSSKYQTLFCFPFPEELLEAEDNAWLSVPEVEHLMSAIQNQN